MSNQTPEGIADLQRLGQKPEEVRKALNEQERFLREKLKEGRAYAEAYLRENPWASLGLLPRTGLMLGCSDFLMRGRD